MWILHFLPHRFSRPLSSKFSCQGQGFLFSRYFLLNLHFHILLMKGDLDSEAEHRPPPPVPGNTGCNHHLTRSNSDASSLTVGNCKNFFRRSENVTPDECTAWTNQNLNSYIYHLEMSFMEQLYQPKSILAHCSRHNLRDINISQKQLINVHNASEQYNVLQNGCWQKINCAAGEPISGSTSTDSHASLESKRTHHSKRRGVPCHRSPTKTPALLKLIGTWKQGKGIISHGIQTCSQELLSSNRSNGELIDLTREGMGQNFLDEDDQRALNFESRAKRLKIALGDGLHENQVMCRIELCFASEFMCKKLLVLFFIQVPVLSDCAFLGMSYIRLFSHQ